MFSRYCLPSLRCQVLWTLLVVYLFLPNITAQGSPPPNPLPAFDLPGETVPAPAAGNQDEPAIARGGDMYLVAWVDARSSYYDPNGEAGSAKDIYAARLDASGDLIDSIPIVVNQDAGDQENPVVVWNGENWLVIWTGITPFGPAFTHTIEAVRVAPSGQVLDPEPIHLWTNGDHNEHLLGAASNGEDWALVFVDYYIQGLGTKVRLVGRRVTPDGAIVSAPYYLFSPACCYFFWEGGIAWADGAYLVVFEGYVSGTEYGIFGMRLSPTLTTLQSYPFPIAQTAMQSETQYFHNAEVAASEDGFFVGWQFHRIGQTDQIYGTRVDPAGQSLDGNGFAISGDLPAGFDQAPQLTWDGTQWIVGWPESELTLSRVAADGNVVDPGGIPVPEVQAAALAGTGSGGLQLAWSDARVGGAMPLDLFTGTMTSDLVLGPDQPVALGTPSQIQPALATRSGGYLLVYRSDVSGETRIMARTLDLGGAATSPEPIQLATGSLDRPDVAYDGGQFLVVWSDVASSLVLGLRLAEDGTILDESPTPLLGGIDPDVAGQNGQFFVTANDDPADPDASMVCGVRVAGDGTVLDPTPLVIDSGPSLRARVTSIAGNWLVVWERTDRPDGSEIQAALVQADGTVVGPVPVTTENDGLSHRRPAVAAGDSVLILWEDARAGDDDWNLYGRRVSSTFTFSDPSPGVAVVTAAGNQRDAAPAWDGTRFLNSFTDDRQAVHGADARTDVYRNWLPAFGVVVETEGLPLYEAVAPEIDPVVVGQDGNSLYAAAVFTSQERAAYRIQVRAGLIPSDAGHASEDLPRVTRLLAPYPNPANPAVKIRFNLGRRSRATVEILDLRGQRVRTLQAGEREAGLHELNWDGLDMTGRTVPSGTYLFRLYAPAGEDAGKLMLVR